MFGHFKTLVAIVVSALATNASYAQSICQTRFMWCQIMQTAQVGLPCWCGSPANGGIITQSAMQQPQQPQPQPSPNPAPSRTGTQGDAGCVEGLGDCGTYARSPGNAVNDSGGLCSQLQRSIAAAPGGFRDIRGPRDADGDWPTDLTLGFDSCYVQHNDTDPPYLYCKSLAQSFDEVRSSIASCLSDWQVRQHTRSSGKHSATFARGGMRTQVKIWEPSSNGVRLSVDLDSDH